MRRRARHQRVDRAAGPIHRVVLHGPGRGEEEEEEHALGPLAHQPGAAGGEEHQQVDVDAAMVAERVPALLRRLPSAGDARAEREQEHGQGRQRGHVRRIRVLHPLHHERGQPERGADRRLHGERPPAVVMSVFVRVVLSHGAMLGQVSVRVNDASVFG